MRNALRKTIAGMGIIAGLAGTEHGIGEILQGNTAPGGLVILSWPTSPFFRIQAGEPAMTIVPNFLVTGILAVLFSLIFVLWATRFIQKKHGSLVLFLLTIVMLLVGAGFGPPFLGLVLSAAATGIHAPLNGWRAHLTGRFGRFLGKLWPFSFGACIVAWLLLAPGSNILGYFFEVDGLILVPVLFFAALKFLLLSILTGLAYDAQRQVVTQQKPSLAGEIQHA